jgi:hypothetical protein
MMSQFGFNIHTQGAAPCVLDLDLDLLQDAITTADRAELDGVSPWLPSQVESWLERQLGCDPTRPIPGRTVEYHDQVFALWRALIETGQLAIPFSVVHADAHADLGQGSSTGLAFLQQHVLPLPLEQRWDAPCLRRAITPGGYLLCAVALRWIKDITYVYHPGLRYWDLPEGLTRDGCPQGDQLPQLGGRYQFEIQLGPAEPCVPLHYVCCDSVHLERDWDFAFIATSPDYVLPATLRLLKTLGKYLAPLDLPHQCGA